MAQIIRGTTPTIQYNFSIVDVADITVAILTIKQDGEVIIEKDLTAATVGESSLSWLLTQEDTLLTETGDATIMLNWKISDGTRGASARSTVSIVNNDKEVVI